MPIITRFGEGKEQWYETPEERIYCNEDVLMKIWGVWVSSCNCRRSDTDDETIFEFIEPQDVDVTPLPDGLIFN